MSHPVRLPSMVSICPATLFAGMAALLLAGACGVTPADPPREPIPIPFTVSDYYSPDGFFGDGATPAVLVLDKTCPTRAPGGRGDCYTVTYKPGDLMYAGIFWQYPHNNWGYWKGHDLAGGAGKIVFQVKGGKGGETVTFGAGEKDNVMVPHKDSFGLRPFPAVLKNEWTTYQMPLADVAYQGPSGVLGAFSFTVTAPRDTPADIVFYLDDVRWEQ